MASFFRFLILLTTFGFLGSFLLGSVSESLPQLAMWHMLVGLGTTLIAATAHCLVFAIFTGAGKDTRILVSDLALNPAWTEKAKSFRRIAFPIAMKAILLLLILAVLGGAAGKYTPLRWAHWGLALLTSLYHIKAFLIELSCIEENKRLLETVNVAAAAQPSSLKPVLAGEPEILAMAADDWEWGQHVFAFGRFLGFMSWQVWLVFIYLRFIMGYYEISWMPFLALSFLLLGAGYYLRLKYGSGSLNSPSEAT